MPSDTYILTIADAGVSTPADGSVTTAKIANLNVTTAKLENYTTAGTGVTTAKLDNGAVTSAKIAATTITDANIAIAANIALSKLATGALPAGITVANATLAASATTAINATTAATCTGNAATATTAAACTGNAATATLATTATNLAVGAAGALPYQTAAGATAFISAVATGNVLLSGGAATVPQYGKVNLTAATHIAGTLPVANGGTGAASLTGYVKASGTAVMTANATIPVADGGTGTNGTSIDGLSFDKLKFKTASQSTDALNSGEVRWNTTDNTLDLKLAGDVTLQVGQETNIYAQAFETITNGQVVYISGATTAAPIVSLASNTNISARSTIGIATQNISAGSKGYITITGLVRDLNLITILGSPISSGDTLWLGTSGNLTKTEPAYPNAKVKVGYIINPINGGSIFTHVNYDSIGLVNGTGKIGYVAGTGSAVTQSTSKSEPVTLHATCGNITMDNAALAHDTTVNFVLTNNRIELGDVLILNHISGGTNVGSYLLNAQCSANSATINVRNIKTANTTLSEAIVIAFVVVKGFA